MSEKEIKTHKKKPEDKTTEKTDESKPLSFSLVSVKEKPHRHYKKGSKYDPLLKQFNESSESMVEINVEGKDANYLRTQLNKIIDSRKYPIKTSVVNDVCYLEKIPKKS